MLGPKPLIRFVLLKIDAAACRINEIRNELKKNEQVSQPKPMLVNQRRGSRFDLVQGQLCFRLQQ